MLPSKLDQLESELFMKNNPYAWGICLVCQKVVRLYHKCPGRLLRYHRKEKK